MQNYEINHNGERRDHQAPIPDDLEYIVNQPQLRAIRELQQLSWKLWFVRRSVFQPITPVMIDPQEHTVIIEEDGTLNTNHGMEFRH